MKTSATNTDAGLRGAITALRREFTLAGLYSAGANLLMLAPTLYMLQVYDRVLVSRNELTLLAVSVITLALLCVVALVEWLRTRLLIAASQRLDRELGVRVMGAGFAAALQPGPDSAPRPLADLQQLRQFLTGSGILAFFDAPWAPIYIIVLFVLHPALGALALLFGIVQCVLAWQGQQRSVAPAEAAAQSAGAEMAFLRAKLNSVETIEAMGMVDPLWQRWQQQHQQSVQRNTTLQDLTHRITASSKFVRYAQQSLVLGLGSLLVIQGQISVGSMLAASVLMTRALAPIDTLVGLWRPMIGACAAFGRLQALLGSQAPIAAAAGDEQPLRGLVQLRRLSAYLPGRAQPILDAIDLELVPGSVTVLVGSSGSGKSTLARAVTGAWPHISGEVLLDGRPAGDWAARGAQLGYLPQEVVLFDGSIAENIARFDEVDSLQVITAARKTGLHDIILRLPRGYDTAVENNGASLPGGLRQRIALARAIYGAPTLVVLDEPNANLDEAGEAALATLARELKREGKTVLLITHRPAILAAADRLVMLRDGKIEREGRPDQVIADIRRAATTPTPSMRPAAAGL